MEAVCSGDCRILTVHSSLNNNTRHARPSFIAPNTRRPISACPLDIRGRPRPQTQGEQADPRKPCLTLAQDLLGKFSDPSSPFYLAPGEVGPASPDDHTVARALPGQELEAAGWTPPVVNPDGDSVDMAPHLDPKLNRTRAAIHEWFDSNGFDPKGRLEWPVAWGEQDMFAHVNNVSYVRYLESQRMRWCQTLKEDMGPELTDDFMVSPQSAALIIILSAGPHMWGTPTLPGTMNHFQPTDGSHWVAESDFRVGSFLPIAALPFMTTVLTVHRTAGERAGSSRTSQCGTGTQ